MKKLSNPFIFFGSGPVAAESLKLLVKDFVVEAVITKPNLLLNNRQSVSDIAKKHGIKLLELADKSTVEDLFSSPSLPFVSEFGLIIDYGIILPKKVIDSFPLGIVNSHFSLLPQWRGPDPISFAILSGQQYTGVSLMLIRTGVDDGPLLAQKKYLLSKTITTPVLTQDLIKLSHKLLVTTLPRYVLRKITPIEQSIKVPVTYSSKLTKADGLIDWTKPAVQLEREIRAYAEWPKSYCSFNRINVTIIAGRVLDQTGKPGKLHIDHKKLFVYCGQQALEITKLKPAGKPVMSTEAFLAGYGKKLIF
ncbi:MAG: methionyl-tRNA formyltransferase [Candidatus Saccharimonadales bacterium]|jgi:methionyl-tRNA formyltransferase